MNNCKNNIFRLPAEWESQRSIILIWPHEETDWKPYINEITQVYFNMVEAISRSESILIIARDVNKVKTYLQSRLSLKQYKNIEFVEADSNDTWARDVAPISLIVDGLSENDHHRLNLLDFCFNGWGNKFPADKDNSINKKIFDKGVWNGTLTPHKDFVLEGGSIECDGHETLFTTIGCLTAPQRNQPLSQDEIEEKLQSFFPNIKRVVWLKHGQLRGDDTDGHIDTIVRIAPNNTLLYIGCEDKNDEHYAELKLLEQELIALRTIDNQPYRLLKLPLPDAIYDEDGERLPATHANFLITNKAILVPTYNQEKKDGEAFHKIKMAFPGREIIGIDSRIIIKQHGSIHCLTMQIPK